MQVLEDLCNRNQWGRPMFSLLSVDSNGGQLFVWKVVIQGLGQQFQPTRLSQNTEDAKQQAAEHVLTQLGCRPYLEGQYQ